MKDLPTLKRKNIKLIQPSLTYENVEIYRKWLKEKSIKKGTGRYETYNHKKTYELLKRWQKDPLKAHWFVYLIENKKEIPIGDILLEIINKINEKNFPEFFKIPYFFKYKDKTEIATAISEKYQGKGFGTLSNKILIDYIFNKLNIKLIVVSFYIDNISSRKMCEKCGFKKRYIFTEKETGKKEIVLSLRKSEKEN